MSDAIERKLTVERDARPLIVRRAGVAGGRLDVDLLERRLVLDPSVRHAVQRHAARHHDIAALMLLDIVADKVDGHVFQDNLKGC